MAITIDWVSQVIFVPQADLSLLSPGVYELDIQDFRLALRALEASPEGAVYPPTHLHNTEVSVGSFVLARAVVIINGYTVEFEDVGSPYTVSVTGGNHNIGEVKVVNQVSLIINNSGGLVVGQGAVDANDIRDAVWNADPTIYGTGTAGNYLNRVRRAVAILIGLA